MCGRGGTGGQTGVIVENGGGGIAGGAAGGITGLAVAAAGDTGRVAEIVVVATGGSTGVFFEESAGSARGASVDGESAGETSCVITGAGGAVEFGCA